MDNFAIKASILLATNRIGRVTTLQMAHDLLEHTDDAIGTITLESGFSNSSHFSRSFKAAFGRRPSDARSARAS